MSDPLNALLKTGQFDPPDSPRSVGWTRPCRVLLAGEQNPLPLDCGTSFYPVTVEYETYGQLAPNRENAIFILHALSGDAHAAGWDSCWEKENRPWRQQRPGWWDSAIGPGKAFDTNRYFIVCANILGSCYGTTGPLEINPLTGRRYGLDFPVVTVQDWVRLQVRLQDYLGIPRLLAVAGGSLGGQQALAWAIDYPRRVRSAIIIAASARLSAQGVAFNTVARHAITSDPHFHGGDYNPERPPLSGLGVARMLGHITYLSRQSMEHKFGRRFQNGCHPSYQLGNEFTVESYLEHQGRAFGERFDANSYLYITRAMDYFDASAHTGGHLEKALAPVEAGIMLLSFSSDWLYPPKDAKEIAKALIANRKTVTYVNLPSIYGHDAFLLETEKIAPLISAFLEKRSESHD